MSAIEANPGSERTWRRRCLWALLVLLPAAIAETSYQPAMALLGSKDFMARDVASDEEVRFGGSDWRLDAMLTTSDTGRAKLPRRCSSTSPSGLAIPTWRNCGRDAASGWSTATNARGRQAM
jgi:hypothetical protein